MFQINQCVMSIFEPLARTGSGSCISRTKLWVPAGTCDHFSSGDTAALPAAIVYLSGMTPPSSHAVVVMSSGGVAGPRPPPRCPAPAGGGVWAAAAAADATTMTAIDRNRFNEGVQALRIMCCTSLQHPTRRAVSCEPDLLERQADELQDDDLQSSRSIRKDHAA